jgi:energy-coupling factor transport system substrate-specific component
MQAFRSLSTLMSAAILVIASLLGLGAFLYPFFMAAAPASGTGMAHANDAPLLTVLLLGLCLTAVFTNLTGRQLTSKLVAVLGVLTALNAVLRAVPGPAGFNAIFVLPILAGYAYGPTFGFLLGALSLLVSALIGSGVGPWLPYQMFATGWMGLLSGLLPQLPAHRRWEPALLAVWGGVLGLIFGAIMNIWFWPFLAGGVAGGPALAQTEGVTWQPGMAIGQTLRNYAAFYVVTSLWWDVARAVGNALLVLLFGRAILRVLRRFQRRFRFDLVPATEIAAPSRDLDA